VVYVWSLKICGRTPGSSIYQLMVYICH